MVEVTVFGKSLLFAQMLKIVTGPQTNRSLSLGWCITIRPVLQDAWRGASDVSFVLGACIWSALLAFQNCF
jgi:hypothetical protein